MTLAAGTTADSTTDKDPTKNTIRISYKNSHLGHPNVWKSFFDGYKSPLIVTSLQVDDCYWIDAKLITDGIVKLVNLRELNIRGTQLSLPVSPKCLQPARKSNACLKIKCMPDGDTHQCEEEKTRRIVINERFPKLVWMKQLNGLVLAKLGQFANTSFPEDRLVQSLLLEYLVKYIFLENRSPVSLQHLCVHQFSFESDELRDPNNLWTIILQATPMKSFDVGDNIDRSFCVVWTNQIDGLDFWEYGLINPDTPGLQYQQLEQLAYFEPYYVNSKLGPWLPKMKYANLAGNRSPVSRSFYFYFKNFQSLFDINIVFF